jgi:membrane protein DedA with SNARE-associated domain
LDAPAPERPQPSRRTLALIVGPILVVVVAGYVGNAIHPTLLNNHPLWLVAMEPRNRYLLLVADKVDFVPFLVVATLRRLASDPLFYLLGYLYGESGVRWMEKRFGDSGALVRATERGFAKAAPALVFFFPGLIVCVLAGATGMSPLVFAALNLAGTLTMVTVLYQLADVLEPVLSPINNFYKSNGKVLTVLAIVLTVWWFWDQRRRGKSELQSISTIEKELEEQRGAERDADPS